MGMGTEVEDVGGHDCVICLISPGGPLITETFGLWDFKCSRALFHISML